MSDQQLKSPESTQSPLFTPHNTTGHPPPEGRTPERSDSVMSNGTFVSATSNTFALGASMCEHGQCLRLDTGVASIQGHRRTMEDQHVTAKSEKQPIHFFGVYDGHGGTKCAEYLRDKLHTIVLENDEVRTNPQQVLREGIAKVEKEFTEFSRESKDCSGSTAAVALVVNGDTLVTANVGDSEIVLCRGGQPVVLTTRHVPSNQGEESRILAAGGRMFRHRVGHPKFNPEFVSLGVSRAIGDIGFKLDEYTDGKQSGVIADADTRLTRLTPEDSFLIMACDGLWDVCSYADVVKSCTDLLAQGKAGQEITDALVADALLKGSTDNVTCMFIGLSHTLPAPPPPKA